jgi:hypothetical protein
MAFNDLKSKNVPSIASKIYKVDEIIPKYLALILNIIEHMDPDAYKNKNNNEIKEIMNYQVRKTLFIF